MTLTHNFSIEMEVIVFIV